MAVITTMMVIPETVEMPEAAVKMETARNLKIQQIKGLRPAINNLLQCIWLLIAASVIAVSFTKKRKVN